MKDKIYIWLKVAFDWIFKLEMSFLAKNANIFKKILKNWLQKWENIP